MKTRRILLFSFSCFIAHTFFAQQTVPNGGFENWTVGGLYQEPTSWATTNFSVVLGMPACVTKSTTAHSGSFSMKCTSVGNATDTIAGEAFLGKIDLQNFFFEEGVPFTSRPDSLVAWIKYTPVGGDIAGIFVSVSKWNASTNSQESVGGGGDFYDTGNTAFKRVSLPINYVASTQPDTLLIAIGSSTDNVHPGSSLWVDDLTFIYSGPLGTIEVPLEAQFAYYPNPANVELTIRANESGTIQVFNALGTQVETLKAQAGETLTLKTAEFKNGVYFLKNEHGATHRFVVQH